MLFAGSPASAIELINWVRSVAPDVTIRERIEYKGWEDLNGHIELELRGQELQAGEGDWLVCFGPQGRRRIDVLSDMEFQARFEPDR